MALSYKARRRWSLLILVIGLPVYAVLAVNLVALLPVLPKLLEFILYVVLGTAWAFPLKFVFKGIGQVDPPCESNWLTRSSSINGKRVLIFINNTPFP